jgi:hypothetical protein
MGWKMLGYLGRDVIFILSVNCGSNVAGIGFYGYIEIDGIWILRRVGGDCAFGVVVLHHVLAGCVV